MVGLALVVSSALAPPARADTPPARPDSLVTFPSPTTRRWQTGVLRTDRLQHAGLSATLAAGVALVADDRRQGFGLALALGLLKEARDARRTGFDVTDLLADALGAWAGASAIRTDGR